MRKGWHLYDSAPWSVTVHTFGKHDINSKTHHMKTHTN